MKLNRPVPKACMISLGFGKYPLKLINLFHRALHTGIDFAPVGKDAMSDINVYAACDSVILDIGYSPSAGNYIIASHTTSQHVVICYYMHLAIHKVPSGSSVKQGDVIGIMGSTGDSTAKHLHFATAFLGLSALQFFDPTKYFVY